MVYLTDEVSGYVSVSFEDVSGYGDDVTGSAYEAYNGASSYTSMPNTEFTMTDSWDVDTFYIDYPGTKNCTYKIELRNRSLKEQEELYRKFKEFRGKSLYLQLEKGQEQYFEKIESLHSEYKDVLTEPVVVDFLSAEQRMCKLMRLVYDGIAENIKLDLSYMDEL